MSPIVAIVAAALRQAAIDADVDLQRDECKQTIRIRVRYRDIGISRTLVYDLHESELYLRRDPAEEVRAVARNLVEYILSDMPAASSKSRDAPLDQFYEKTIVEAIVASGWPPPWPPPTPASAPAKPDGPRLLDLDAATVEPRAQPKREIDV